LPLVEAHAGAASEEAIQLALGGLSSFWPASLRGAELDRFHAWQVNEVEALMC
jgi:hypothetical protein